MPWFSTTPAPTASSSNGSDGNSVNWDSLTSLPSQIAQQLGGHAVGQMARQGLDKASLFVSDLMASGGNDLVQRTQDRFDKAQAKWRWSSAAPLGYSQAVPMPAEPNNKLVLAGLSLARVLHDQVSRDGDMTRLISQHPVTLCLVLASSAVFLKPGGVLLRDVCLSPYCVLELGQVERLLLPAFVHLDATHLLANLAAALPDCLALERSTSSAVFAAELVGLTVASHATYVLWAWSQKVLLRRPAEYYSVGALGLSSLAFALQVISGERASGSACMLLPGGLRVPARFGWVIQLALTHMCAPDSSFAGHLSGVAAGLMYVYGVQPVLKWVGVQLNGAQTWQDRDDEPRFYGAGTTGGRVISTDEGRRRNGWKRWRVQLGSQLGLMALAAGLFVWSNRHSSASRRSSYW